jgi:hypothetical protein
MSFKISVAGYVAAAAGALVIGTALSLGVILSKNSTAQSDHTVGMAPAGSKLAKQP